MRYLSYFVYGLLLSIVGMNLPAISVEFDFKNFEFWANQCLQLSENKNATEALTACERAITLQPNRANSQLWLARSQVLMQTGKYAEAIASYDQVLKNSPKSSFALFAQCNALVQLDRYEDAIDQCDRALQLNGDWGKASPTAAWTYRGIALRRQGYLETALASFDRAVLMQSDDPWAKAEQCVVSLELKQTNICDRAETAVVLFEQALARSPDNALIWIQQGLALEQLGRDEQALASYNQAVQLSPNQFLPLTRRCGVFNQLGNDKAALESCNQALQNIRQTQKWQLAYLWTQHAQALLGLEKLDEAIASADRAIAIQPNYAPAFNIKALAYWKQFNYLQANQQIQQAIQAYQQLEKVFQDTFYRDYPESLVSVHRGEIVVLFNQGRIYSSQKQYYDAIDSYKKAISLYKENLDSSEKTSSRDRQLLASIYTNQSAAYLNIGKYNEAQEWAVASLALKPNSFAAIYNQALSSAKLGEHHEKSGNQAEAKKSYQAAADTYDKANQLSPNNLYVLIGQAEILEKLNQPRKAIAVYEQILRIDPTSQRAKEKFTALASSLLVPPNPIQQSPSKLSNSAPKTPNKPK